MTLVNKKLPDNVLQALLECLCLNKNSVSVLSLPSWGWFDRRALRAQGLRVVSIYWPMPDAIMPQWLIPLSGYKPFAFSISRVFKGSSAGAKIKRASLCLMFRLCLLKYFAPKVVICKKVTTTDD